jgi:hypothetical protein
LDYRHRDRDEQWQDENYPVYLDTTPERVNDFETVAFGI